MDILKKAMDTLTSMASVRDGMGLEDRMHSDKGKEKEPIPAHPAESHRESDAEGSANESVNQADQLPAGTSLRMMIEAQRAKNASKPHMEKLLMVVGQANILVSAVYAMGQVT
ncbi:hypothetical protein VPH35_053065 [Triticum aestivum]